MNGVAVPAVSVIVPTYDRPERLVACADALAGLLAPEGGFEVIVVDDGSPTPVAPHLAPFEDRLELTVVRQANAGPAAARNTGAARARGRLLAFTDDDCRPHARWALALSEVAAADDGAGLMLGGQTIDRAGGPFARASQVLLDHLYDHHRTDPDGAFFASNNLAVDRDTFLRIGGFDTSFPRPGGEDRELGDRWSALGHRHRFVPEAVVDHHHAMGWREFWRQHRTYGEGAYAFHRIRAARLGHGVRPQPPSFYLRLLSRPHRTGTPQPSVVAALLVVSQVANAVGFALAARRERRARR